MIVISGPVSSDAARVSLAPTLVLGSTQTRCATVLASRIRDFAQPVFCLGLCTAHAWTPKGLGTLTSFEKLCHACPLCYVRAAGQGWGCLVAVWPEAPSRYCLVRYRVPTRPCPR